MSDWFNVGFEEAERMTQRRESRQNYNFWVKPGETAVVRFLSPARDTFNIKRAFVKEAKGQKYFTSPMVEPDPFVRAGYALQATFVWKILDRRILEFTDRNGQDKTIGPRILYFAVGQRDRKALLALEAQMLQDYNEQLKEENKKPVDIDKYNITNFDIRLSKDKSSPWSFIPVRGGIPKALSKEDKTLIEEQDFTLEEELKPLPVESINSILSSIHKSSDNDNDADVEYSYDPKEVDQPTFFPTT